MRVWGIINDHGIDRTLRFPIHSWLLPFHGPRHTPPHGHMAFFGTSVYCGGIPPIVIIYNRYAFLSTRTLSSHGLIFAVLGDMGYRGGSLGNHPAGRRIAARGRAMHGKGMRFHVCLSLHVVSTRPFIQTRSTPDSILPTQPGRTGYTRTRVPCIGGQIPRWMDPEM